MFSAKDLVFAKGPAGGYTIAKSLRFRSSASAYLSRTPGSAGNRTTWTWSGWVKRGKLGASQSLFGAGLTSVGSGSTYMTGLIFTASDQLGFYWASSGGTVANTTAVYRDPSAWYHIVAVANSTTFLIYVNGSQVLSNAISGSGAVNSAVIHALGAFWDTGGSVPYINNDCYLAEINFIDGQALDPTYFGQTDTATGVWMPKKYTGTYGTNGFYLNFSDASGATATTIGKDSSGNGNNWTPNNISVTAGVTYDSMVDTPTNYDNGGNGAGNYAVLNPLSVYLATVSDGNLKTTYAATGHSATRSTMQLPAGVSIYAESTVGTTTTASIATSFGLILDSATTANSPNGAGYWNLYASNAGSINNNGTNFGSLAAFTAGDVLQVAYDGTNNRAWFGKNNVWYDNTGGTTGNPATGSNPTVTSLPTGLFIGVTAYANSQNVNFGQRGFTYTPPSGFKALCTQNLPTPTIGATSSTLANKYMDVSLYTGTGASQSITNSGSFQPDFLWIKSRSVAASHILVDAVRTVSQELSSNDVAAETTNSGRITSFNSNGWSLGATAAASLNQNGATYVGWQWKANGSGTLNQQGSINSTVSANVTAGFSVVTYTGTGANATVGHGLGVAPKMVIVFERSPGGDDHIVYHAALTSNQYSIRLNTTAAQAGPSAAYWNSTSPSSTVFSLGTSGECNQSTATYVAYCFAEVAGYSKFGSYTGNGSADGPFVYCGFRPRFVMIKATGAAEGWNIFDTSRDTYNPELRLLFPNTADAEFNSGSTWADITANGFKIRYNGSPFNTSTATYIFAAFAESPFNYARAR